MAASKTRDDMLLEDFATIFAHMWYRDFPLQHSVREKAQRADWTTHIGIAVRSTADLMGLFTCFESGVRTDAVLRDNSKGAVAALEWEWAALHSGKVNEFKKLVTLCGDSRFKGLRFAGLVVYGRKGGTNYTERTEKVLDEYEKSWSGQLPPLLLVVIYFQGIGKHESRQRREFKDMEIFEIVGGSRKLLRQQPACPWDVHGSRWAKDSLRLESRTS
jgi:hypothetical protein